MSACFFFSHLSWAFPTGNVWRVIAFQLMRSIHLVKRFKGYQLVENSFTHISRAVKMGRHEWASPTSPIFFRAWALKI
jgi:hypothetical protein